MTDYRIVNRANRDARADAGLRLTGLVEHVRVPWEAVDGQITLLDDGQWRLTDRPWRVAHSYPLQAVREGRAV